MCDETRFLISCHETVLYVMAVRGMRCHFSSFFPLS